MRNQWVTALTVAGLAFGGDTAAQSNPHYADTPLPVGGHAKARQRGFEVAETRQRLLGWGIELRAIPLSFHREPVTAILHLPLNVRTVPIHPDDGSGVRVFDDSWLDVYPNQAPTGYFPDLLRNEYSVLPQIKIGRARFKAGVTVPLGLEEWTPNIEDAREGSKHITELNYFGNGRGFGTALVYLAARSRRSRLVQPMLELEIQVADSLAIQVGIVSREYRVEVETGWDRHDALETYHTYDAGKVNVEQFFIGIDGYVDGDDRANVFAHVGLATPVLKPNLGFAGLRGRMSRRPFVNLGLSLRLRSW